MLRIPTLLCTLALTSLLVSCKEPLDCGCTPVPRESVTTARLAHVWQLDEVQVVGGQFTKGAAIKDRYRLEFRADGRYTQQLLADSTTFTGTWQLLGTDNHTLHFVDHKGADQEYTIEGASDQYLMYGRNNKDGKYEVYTFSLIR